MFGRQSRSAFRLLPLSALFLAPGLALAQQSPNGTFPADPAPTVAPAPAAAPAPAVAPAPAAAPAPAPQAYAQDPAPAAPPPQPYAQDPNAQPGYGAAYGGPPPAPPAAPEDEGFDVPPFSVRVDPFNWLLGGRLGFELEVALAKWISIETVPVFIVNDSPPLFNLNNHEDNLYQGSNGWGALAGASLGINFWLSGQAFSGYVLRAGVTNYGLEYETKDGDGARIDFVTQTERRFYVMFGSSNRWGAFTLGGGIGLAYELNQRTRCYPQNATSTANVQDSGCDDELQIALDRNVNAIANLNGPLFPMDILGRISLGVIID